MTAQGNLAPEKLEQIPTRQGGIRHERRGGSSGHVNQMPVNTGGRGKAALRMFYRDVFIPSWPDDLVTTTRNRVIGAGQLVKERHSMFRA